MLKIFKPKSEFSRNVITLMMGSGLSQVILIVVSPILTRLFIPENFGTSALFLSISSILLILTTGRYEMAIVQTRKDVDAVSLVFSTIFISVIFFLLFLIIYYCCSDSIQGINLDNKLDGLLILVPIYVLIANIYKIVTNYMNRNKQYKIISTNLVAQSIFQSSSKLYFGFIHLSENGLIVGTVVGQFLAALFLIDRFINLKIKKSIYILAIKRIKMNLAYYINFPKYLLLSDGINVIALQLPYLMTSYLFSMKELGFLSLAYSMSAAPLSFLGTSLSRVFRQKASEEYNKKGKCDVLFLSMLKKLILYLTLPFIVIFFTAPYLFRVIFGEEWLESGHLVQILIFMFFFQFLARILSYMYILTSHQKENLNLQFNLLISTAISFSVGYILFHSLYISLLLYSISYSFMYIYMIYKSYIYSKGQYNEK